MKPNGPPDYRLGIFFLLLNIVCLSPVWTVGYFINQDGSAHLHSSYLMLELLRGDPAAGEVFALNSISVPNSSGHWLMALLLLICPPFLITKIIVTMTFSGLVAAAGWLRFQTAGRDGLKTSLLLGAAIGFNWLWFVGFYNFMIGVGCFVLTIGLFFGWREKINFPRAAVLALLFLLAYFSHIVSFAVLFGSVVMLCFTASNRHIKRNLGWVFAALLPVIPLMLIYKTVSASGGGFFPVWRNLANPLSIGDWFAQLRTVDPFIIISRRSLPFLAETSGYFAVFTPLLWISAALLALAAATFRTIERTALLSREYLIFVVLFAGTVLAAVFAPDDFGLNNGSILRERLFLCGLIFFIPVFRAAQNSRLKRIAQTCLGFVLIFQTAALMDYARATDRKAVQFFAVQNKLGNGEKLASIVVVGDESRFHSIPMTMINNYSGIAPGRIAWDNYEIGHYLFPVVAKTAADKRFVFDLTRYNSFSLNFTDEKFGETLSNLENCLAENNRRISVLLVWGKEPRIDAVLKRWYAEDPGDERAELRIFRRRTDLGDSALADRLDSQSLGK